MLFRAKRPISCFLVLGKAKDRIGEEARTCASSSPNLLNVAMTRDKSRLYVIGNIHTWSKMNYFSTLAKTHLVKTICSTISIMIEL